MNLELLVKIAQNFRIKFLKPYLYKIHTNALQDAKGVRVQELHFRACWQ